MKEALRKGPRPRAHKLHLPTGALSLFDRPASVDRHRRCERALGCAPWAPHSQFKSAYED
jgi:hypothetical protein